MTAAAVDAPGGMPAEVSRGPSLLGAVGVLVARDLRRFFRQPSRVVGSLAQPLILWLVLGAGLQGSFRPGVAAGADAVGYLQYFYPGIVVLTMLFTAIFSTISVIDDRHHGFLQAVLAAPTSRAALVLGKTLGGVTIASLQAGALLLLAPLAGFSLGQMNWPLLAAVLFLGAVGFTALGFAMAGGSTRRRLPRRHERRADPALMLSGAMFPPSGTAGC